MYNIDRSAVQKKVSTTDVEGDRLLSIEEACQYLHICKKTLQKLRASGAIDFYQYGRKIIFSEEHIKKFLEDNKKDAYKYSLNYKTTVYGLSKNGK